MDKSTFKACHRMARMSALCTLSCRVSGVMYRWFLEEVYDLRFPRVGGSKYLPPRSFDPLRGKLGRRGGVIQRIVFA